MALGAMDVVDSVDVGGTMTIPVYPHQKPLPIIDSYISTTPLLLLVALFIVKHHTPQKIRKSAIVQYVIRPFKTYLTIEEAEASAYTDKNKKASPSSTSSTNQTKRTWRTIALGILALFEALTWCAIATYTFSTLPILDPKQDGVEYWWNAVVMFLAWAYCAYRPLRRPKATPLYDCLTIHLLAGFLAVLHCSRYAYDAYVYNDRFFRDPLLIAGTTLNLFVIFLSLFISFSTHIANPSAVSGLVREKGDNVRANDGHLISPEDYTTLWKWLTFGWMTPVTQQKDLAKEEDVWNLSPPMATRAIYAKYMDVGKTFYPDATGKVTPRQFFWHWWRCNSLDVILQWVLSTSSALLDFTGPLFLKLILDCISQFTSQTAQHRLTPVEIRTLRAQAVIYALLYFFFMVLKAGTDLHHLWYGRRAANRTRNEIMMWIYEKALRRREIVAPPMTTGEKKDGASKPGTGTSTPKPDAASTASTTNGASNGKATKAEEDAKKEKDKKEKEEEEKKEKAASADLGKVVNLMSTDTKTIESIIHMGYFFYNAPLQLVVSLFFLYKLMGVSAFAGAIVFVAVAPLNHILSGMAVKIYENVQTTRDKKMSVLNEMISEIKFIKFLAYEDQWTQRALEARNKELKVILQSGYLDIAFSFVWHAAPVGVSVVSFWVYIWSGHKLTVSTAFTVIQLFSLLSMPLGALPMVLVRYLKVKVSVTRIAKFLGEPEVDDDISSFKNGSDNIRREGREGTDVTLVGEDHHAPSKDKDKLKGEKIGIVNGYFLWSEPTPPPKDDKKDSQKPWYRRKFWKKQKSSSDPIAAAPDPLPQDLPDGVVTPGPLIQEVEAVDTSTLNSRISTPATPTASTIAKAERHFELKDINVFFPPGELSLITGPTASGKTALLRALLGEMYTVPAPAGISSTASSHSSTQIYLPKRPWILDPSTGLRDYISYAAQTPWLEHLTIKENVLFGSPYEEERYQAVLECCALKPDLSTFEDGDETEIGERGVSLSGGQKARVALARAIYAPTKYVLLDDPLSAVDSHTARFLFDRLLTGPLLANRTVILVTHHVDLVLSGAGYLVRMLDGRIDTQGTISELRERGLLKQITAEAKKEKPRETTDSDEKLQDEDGGKATQKDKKKAKKLVEEEEIAEGRVKLSVYHSYIKASAYVTWVGIIFFTFIGSGMQIAEKLWMQIWGEAYEARPALTGSLLQAYSAQKPMLPAATFFSSESVVAPAFPSADEHPMFYVAAYAVICLMAVVGEILASAILIFGAYRASKILFMRLLDGVTRATMRWHDTTPTGRILNRFSKDFETIDTTIATSFSYTLNCIASVILSIVTILVISPLFLLPGAVIAYMYVAMSKVYLRTTRPLKRLDSTTISPIFASFRTTLEGLATIRAFSAERRFLDTMMKNLDVTTKCYWTYWMVNRWVLARFDWLGSFTVVVVMIIVATVGGHTTAQEVTLFGQTFTAFKDKSGSFSSGFEGLAIVTAMNFTWSVYWACRFISQLELDLNSVERIDQYLELPQEPPAIVESNRPPAYWPSTTSPSSVEKFISVEDLVIKYAPDLPAVLHGVSFDIKAGERVGLVGRTGSGKSTLATALLRFVDPVEGRIAIDGIDITTIGLYDLRSRVTFIPQDSVLFSGTIRQNLDPFDENTDEACLDVLRRVHLIEQSPTSTRPASVIEEGPSVAVSAPSSTAGPDTESTAAIKLDSLVSPSGSNFSHGQRQLIALARALLRKTSVIVMDEATSSIDFETDNKIQAAIREEFGSNCVITIAHRLQTIIDYDRVIVMDAGKLVENGPPRQLMENKEGIFYAMCAKAGIVDDE